MPRIALLCLALVGACSFDADYTSGTYSCSDDKCPSGLVCQNQLCVAERRDAAVDVVDTMQGDASDGQMAELSCALPGALAATGGADSGTTVDRTSHVGAQCGGFLMAAGDAVYRITPGAGKQMTISVSTMTTSFMVFAYVTTMCPASVCSPNMVATPGNSLVVTTVAGPQYIVVDSYGGMTGPYMLNVTVN
ncbi:MAG TPA: hypothetical protein VFV99_31640 [Kofleriaceae bacterium]|nr:hypothetical protein [Kofleriaceae bacterium]